MNLWIFKALGSRWNWNAVNMPNIFISWRDIFQEALSIVKVAEDNTVMKLYTCGPLHISSDQKLICTMNKTWKDSFQIAQLNIWNPKSRSNQILLNQILVLVILNWPHKLPVAFTNSFGVLILNFQSQGTVLSFEMRFHETVLWGNINRSVIRRLARFGYPCL